MLLGMMRLAGNHMNFWKSVRNQMEISWKSVGNQLENSYSSTMVIEAMLLGIIRLAGNCVKFWKESNVFSIMGKSGGNLLKMSWKYVGNLLEIS